MAIASLRNRPGSTLRIPHGTYRFAAHDGVAMVFDDMDDVTVDGTGATLLFNGTVAPLLMRRCRAPVLRGFAIDWERPPFSQGQVIQVGSDGSSVTLRIDPEFPVEGTEKVIQLGTYDHSTRAMKWHGIDAINAVAEIALVGSQLLRLTLNGPLPFKLGETVVVRHGNGPHAVSLENCQDVSIQNVAIYASPAMGIAMGGCAGAALEGVHIEQKPGSDRLMSTDADGLHCASCSGKIDVVNCRFSGMGDDGINVSGLYIRVEADRDNRRLRLVGRQNRPPAPFWAAPQVGDSLLLVSGLTLRPLGEVQIQRLERKEGATEWSLESSDDYPALSGEPVFVIDLQARTQLRVSNCAFRGNRARGVVAHSDAAIEQCSFEYQSDSAVLLAPDMFWQEGPAVERTVVRNNTIRSENLLQRAPAAVWIGAFISPGGHQGTATPEIVNRNVAVEGNLFVSPNGAAVAAAATRDLRIEHNRIEQASPVVFSMGNVRNVQINENRCDPPGKIQVDASSRGQLAMSRNIGLRLT
jgi:hypothetical protein